MAKANAIVIDKELGWGAEKLPPEDYNDKWKKHLFNGRWLPIVIRSVDSEGNTVYTQPVAPKDVKAPPEKLWRALTAIEPICRKLFPGDSAWLKRLKIASMVAFMVVIGFVVLVLATEMIPA